TGDFAIAWVIYTPTSAEASYWVANDSALSWGFRGRSYYSDTIISSINYVADTGDTTGAVGEIRVVVNRRHGSSLKVKFRSNFGAPLSGSGSMPTSALRSSSPLYIGLFNATY